MPNNEMQLTGGEGERTTGRVVVRVIIERRPQLISVLVDHNPPHFHATQGEHEVAIAIRDGEVLWGSLPGRALAHVQEWRQAHLAELEDDWEPGGGSL